jgi:hypothetical protein
MSQLDPILLSYFDMNILSCRKLHCAHTAKTSYKYNFKLGFKLFDIYNENKPINSYCIAAPYRFIVMHTPQTFLSMRIYV